ncbi:MAG: FAD-binding protein [Chitinophagales bacterium]|nr:FAD-binding protein [Chitinophagales bacterium]MDW8272718.1 FAD-binding protein [Chitinophagales bacterium]
MQHKPKGIFEYILTYYRGEFATIFLLPVSVIYGAYLRWRQKISLWLNTAPNLHAQRVQKVIDQVLEWQKSGANVKLTTSRSGWFTMSELVPAYKKTHRHIHINMRDIISINTDKQTVTVEPFVNMGQITAALNPRGWTLPVVPELDDLTVGGLINGFGVESSSHRYGLFQYIVQSIDIVTAEGKLLHCSPEQNQELFYNIPWSHGTLGFLVAAELKIIPCKPYVRLEYLPVVGLDNIVSTFEQAARNNNYLFVEMLLYGLDEAVLMTGTFAERPDKDGTYNPIGRWYKPWFYKHVYSIFKDNQKNIEYIPLRHYYHRHTRSLFWEMEEIIPFGNHPVFRWLLGWALPPQISLLKYFETETTKRLREQFHVVQDMLMPISKLKDSLLYFHNHFQVYPLWLCPMAIYDYPNEEGFLKAYRAFNGTTDPLYVDIGAYGTSKKEDFAGLQALRDLEQFVISNQGYQAMYAKTMLSRQDFRKMFDHKSYDKLRATLPFCDKAFPEVYDKLGGKARISPSEYRKLSKRKAATTDIPVNS